MSEVGGLGHSVSEADGVLVTVKQAYFTNRKYLISLCNY